MASSLIGAMGDVFTTPAAVTSDGGTTLQTSYVMALKLVPMHSAPMTAVGKPDKQRVAAPTSSQGQLSQRSITGGGILTAPLPSTATDNSYINPMPPLSVASNGRCGNPTGQSCLGSLLGNCCSAEGACGSGDIFCDLDQGCQARFGMCTTPKTSPPAPITHDNRCGIWNGATLVGTSCDPSAEGLGTGPCCDVNGICNSDPIACNVGSGCQPSFGTCMVGGLLLIYSNGTSIDGKCGNMGGMGNSKTCIGSEFGECCSQEGLCGTLDQCNTQEGCQPDFGICNSAVDAGISPDGRCGINSGFTCLGRDDLKFCCAATGTCGNDSISCNIGLGCSPDFGICRDIESSPAASVPPSSTLKSPSVSGSTISTTSSTAISPPSSTQSTPTPTQTTTPTADNGLGKFSMGGIIGLSIGLIALVIFLIWLIRHFRDRKWSPFNYLPGIFKPKHKDQPTYYRPSYRKWNPFNSIASAFTSLKRFISYGDKDQLTNLGPAISERPKDDRRSEDRSGVRNTIAVDDEVSDGSLERFAATIGLSRQQAAELSVGPPPRSQRNQRSGAVSELSAGSPRRRPRSGGSGAASQASSGMGSQQSATGHRRMNNNPRNEASQATPIENYETIGVEERPNSPVSSGTVYTGGQIRQWEMGPDGRAFVVEHGE